MKFKEDPNLTEKQKTLKWSLYCESEFEDNKDTKAVLESMLKDLKEEMGE